MPLDYSEYPPNWKTEIVPRIKARAGNCCEECGVFNHSLIKRGKGSQYRLICDNEREMIKAKVNHAGYTHAGAIKALGFTKVVLTIAHLKHDKLNWDVKAEDLKALCQRCHLRLDIKHHTANRKYGRNHQGKHQMSLL